jgi:hypothetical protein
MNNRNINLSKIKFWNWKWKFNKINKLFLKMGTQNKAIEFMRKLISKQIAKQLMVLSF